jgi:hypothetical protein
LAVYNNLPPPTLVELESVELLFESVVVVSEEVSENHSKEGLGITAEGCEE